MSTNTTTPSFKLNAGAAFPDIEVPTYKGSPIKLGEIKQSGKWRLVIVYRGKHCPICTRYLLELNEKIPKLTEAGVELVAVSADSQTRAEEQLAQVEPKFEVGYDLSIEQMQSLGLYISTPRSADESDRPFAEPGLFLINDQGQIQVLDISNAPFARPSLDSLLMGINFIKNPENSYPIRGTYSE